jgi:hypothetical protein
MNRDPTRTDPLDIELQAEIRSSRPTRTIILNCAAVACVAVIALLWFAPIFQGKSFSDVGGQQNVVYPWKAFPNAQVTFPQSDQADLTFPWQSELEHAINSGTIPWWNPESFGGQPFFANGSSGLLYPPRLLLALTVNATTAHNLLSISDVVMAGVFMYLLLADLELSPLAAILGAVAWMFGSFSLVWLQLEVIAPLFAFLPAGMAAIRRAVTSSIRWTVLAGLVIATMFVSSHVLLAGVAVGAILIYGVCLAISAGISAWLKNHGWGALRGVGRIALSAALGLGLSAFVLLPTLNVIKYIARSPFSYSDLAQQFLLAPSAFRYTIQRPALPINQFEMQSMVFVGISTVVLAVVGLFARRKGVGLGRGLVVVIPLVAMGGPLTWLVFRFVPGMQVFRPYARLVFLFDFGIAVLAAAGLDVLIVAIRGRESRGQKVATHRKANGGPTKSGRSILAAAVAIALITLTAVELGQYGRQINTFEPSSATLQFPETPLIRALLASQPPGSWPNTILPVRVTPTSTYYDAPILFSNESLVFGISSAGGYDSSVPTRTVDFWQVVAGLSPASAAGTKLSSAYQPTFGIATTDFAILPRVGVNRIVLTPNAAHDPTYPLSSIESLGWRQIYSGPDGTVLGWTGAPIGPTVVSGAEYRPDDKQALETFSAPTFPYENTAVIDAPGHSVAPAPGVRSQILSARSSYNTQTITVRSSASGWLVIPDMWDPGWSATVNGASTEVLRSNYNERAVAIPAGVSEVHLQYLPPGLITGTAVAGFSLVASVAILFAPTVIRRRKAAGRRRMAEGELGETERI